MRRIRAFFIRLAGSMRKDHLDRQLAEEIDSHLELHTDDNMRAGMNPVEARREAFLKLGGIGSAKESWRDRASLPWLDSLLQDLRYGLRMLRRFPAFSAVAVLSLALGIGANTAIFTWIDALLLRTLPVEEPERLYTWAWSTDRFKNQNGFTIAAYEAFRQSAGVFSDITCRRIVETGLDAGGRTDHISVELVSGNYFAMLGVKAHIGRLIVEEDGRPFTGNRVAVVSHEFWQRYFGSDATILGRTIYLGGTPFVVIGVTEKRFSGLDPGFSPEIRIPMNPWQEAQPGWNTRARKTQMLVSMVGRLQPTATISDAENQLNSLFRHTQEEMLSFFPDTSPEQRKRSLSSRISVQSASKGLFGLGRAYEKSLPLAMVAVGTVVLIACVNVATLLLARGTARQREIAVRLSLGAGRRRILRQLFTESLLLAALGGLLGLLVSYWVTHLFLALIPPQGSWRVALSLSPDWRVTGFLIALTFLTSFIFGWMPAVFASRPELSSTLKASSLSTASRLRAGGILVSVQVALSLTLLMSAGLLLRTLHNLRALESGFQQDRLTMLSLNPGLSSYTPQRARLFYQQALQQLSSLPGVQSVSLDRFGLYGRPFGIAQMAMRVEGHAPRGDEATNPLLAPHRLVVGPGFFHTVGIPLLLGREFAVQDNESAPKVAVINEQFAKYYFGDASPIGRRIGWQKADIAIVGVVRNARYYAPRKQQLRAWYVPYLQAPDRETRATLLVRMTGDPATLIPMVRQQLQAIDRKVPITAITSLKTRMDEKLSTERMLGYLLAALAALSALLAAIGLYGVVSYSVARRTRDLGIRLAIGANRRQLIWTVLRHELLLVSIGLIIGSFAALAVSRLTGSFLFGVKPTDAATLSASILLMCAIAAVAAWFPARRAVQVDPMVALRCD